MSPRRRHRGQRPWGTIYKQKTSRFWWLMVKFPGEPLIRRSTGTEDEAEAERQKSELLAERSPARRQRRTAEQTTVADLLDLVLLDYADHGRTLQVGRIEPWYAAFGALLATEIERADVDDRCRRWRSHGPSWAAGSRTLSDGRTLTWPARPKERVRKLSGASLNRLVAVLRRAYKLGKEKLQLTTALTFPHFAEGRRGEYISEDQCVAICTNFQAKVGAAVKADVFRLAYLKGIRKGQLRATRKRNVSIDGATWKLTWSGEETKNKQPHVVVLVGEELEIVQRAWNARRPDCDFLFHVDGKPLGPMRSELQRTCALLRIPYGRTRGIVFHDTRHSAVTNLVASGTGEAIAMSITGHADPSVFKRYNVRRDPVQAEAAERQAEYLRQQRGTTPTIPAIGPKKS
jgi:integrase